MTTYTLLSAGAATGSAVSTNMAGDYVFTVAGTFGGATVGLQMLGPDGSTWISIADATAAIAMTVAGTVVVSIPIGSYRATITGGAGMSIYAKLERAT